MPARHFAEGLLPYQLHEHADYLEIRVEGAFQSVVHFEAENPAGAGLFREHSGIDPKGGARLICRTILMSDQSAGGGSTITQQLAKMLYSDRDFSGMGKVQKTVKLIYMKLREWITAVKLERSYTKEEILAMYLNQFNFINNAYGIHAASEVYFGKDQKKLRIEDCLLYTSDAADERSSVDLGGRRIIKKKKR